MIYNINDRPPIEKWILLSIQMVLSIFVATVLIANLCGVNVAAGLIGAGFATIVYLIATNFQSPMFISNSGAFVAAICLVFSPAINGGYTGVLVGGITTFLVYSLFGLIFTYIPIEKIYKIFPKVLIGSITVCIGINLMAFIPTYIGDVNLIKIGITLFTMLIIAISSHYCKGILSMFPLLIGTIAGYLLSMVFGYVDFSSFNKQIICIPDYAFLKLTTIPIATIITIIPIYIAFTISAMMECLSDHAALSNIIEVDLYKKPGLNKIFFGEGLANLVGTFIGGLNTCSYGESIATIGFSKCASICVTCGAALILILLGFLAPVQDFIKSIPSFVFAGDAIILYGFIANSGIKILQTVNFNKSKNLILCSLVLSIGISGIAIGNLSGIALALPVGVIMNLILFSKE